MNLNQIPPLIAQYAATRRTADERRRQMRIARKASELVAYVSSEQAKRRTNADRGRRNNG